jgi:uncharacterized protein
MTEKTDKISRIKYIFKATVFCAAFTGLFVIFSFLKPLVPERFERFAHGIAGTAAAILVTYLFLRIDRKSFVDIGLKIERATPGKFITGILTGIGLMGFMALGVVYFSGLKIELNRDCNILHFFFWTLALIPLAFMEEIGFRAYPLVLLKDKAGLRTSILVTSILFGLYHLANGWTFSNSFLGAGVWGIFYGTAAIHSKGIAFPTGIIMRPI